jgi:SAM-dependent methyltransferase
MDLKKESLIDLSMPEGFEKIECTVECYQIYQVLTAAVELKLFDYLASAGACDRKVIAEGIGINGMFSRSFLDTLTGIDLLSKTDEKYENTQVAREFLLSASPNYQGDWILNIGRGNHWSNLVESLKRQQQDLAGFKAGPGELFLSSLAETALRGELQAVTKEITAWDGFKNARSVLDVGGGHGLYTIALCQVNPNLKGVIFDKPHVTGITHQFIAKYGMEERIATLDGDICTDNFGTGYDIVIVSHLLYKFRKDLEPVFAKVYESLKPGGLLVANHWFCATGCVPDSSSVRELSKSLQSFGHPLCHIEEFYKVFEKMGFGIIKTCDIPSAHGNSCLQLAVKDKACKKEAGSHSCCC